MKATQLAAKTVRFIDEPKPAHRFPVQVKPVIRKVK